MTFSPMLGGVGLLLGGLVPPLAPALSGGGFSFSVLWGEWLACGKHAPQISL